MKKKSMVLIVSLMLICILMSGCVETNIGVKINGEGGGDITTTLLIEKGFYDMMAGGEMSGLEGMTEGQTTIDETEYVTFTGTKSYTSYKEMENALLDMSFLDNGGGSEDEAESVAKIFKSVEIKEDSGLLENQYSFKAVTNIQETDESMEMSGVTFSDVFKLKLEVAMPGTISESKGGKAEGGTLVCDISNLLEENEITAVSKSWNIPLIVIAIVLLILIVVLLFALSGKSGAKG